MLQDLIIENGKLIDAFEKDEYINNQIFSIAASLAALETTNEIQECYFKENEECEGVGKNLLKLYALLQSLFVSVDSLYSLSYALTKSKNFININKNQNLRELKYIRNDVVGHPSNRVYNSSSLAYCILDNQSVKHNEFAYNIYTQDGVERKKIQIDSIVNSYYLECNNLLAQLLKLSDNVKTSSKFVKIIYEAIDLYLIGGDYSSKLNLLKKEYMKKYQNSSASQNRIIWRLELIDSLSKYENADLEIMDLIYYSIGLEIIKIYDLLSSKKYNPMLNRRKPALVSSFYRFLKKNKSIIPHVSKICDIKDPLFSSSINYLIRYAKQKNVIDVIKYLELIKKYYEENEDELLYSISLPIREYNKK